VSVPQTFRNLYVFNNIFLISCLRDRAIYDPNLSTAVEYTVADPADAPLSLTFGPSFFSLAADMPGDVIIGLNRELNDQENTRAAAVQAKNNMPNLFAIELGNEPDCEMPTSWLNSLVD